MKLPIRSILIGVVIIIVVAFVVVRQDQLIELGETIQRGLLLPLIGAVVVQLGKYYAQSWSYHFAFAAVGERMTPRQTLPLVFGTFFMNTIAPSLNMAGATLVVDDARRRGIEPGKSMSAVLLMQMTIESGFMTIMIFGFFLLHMAGKLAPLWFLLGLIVLCMVASMVVIMALGKRYPSILVRILSPLERLVNRVLIFFKRKPLDSWVSQFALSFGVAAGIILAHPRTAAKAFGCSVIASSCELTAFCLAGYAFGITDIEALVCGYVIATLCAMISITPQGVGVVEAAVVVLLGAYGVSGAAGMASVMVYRGIVFWMPFLIGALLIQRTKTFHPDKKDLRSKSS